MEIQDSNERQMKNWKSKTTDWLGFAYRLTDCLILFVVLSSQNCWLSYCITAYNRHNNSWYFLFFVDFVMTFLFMFGAFIATRYYRKLHVLKRDNKFEELSNKREDNNRREYSKLFKRILPVWLGSLPLIWICWVLYVVVMSAKIFILHLQDIALRLYLSSQSEYPRIESEPHTIRLCLGAMTVVFLLWIEIHRNNSSNASKECIKELTTTVVFEIFDSIDLLDLLLPESKNDVKDWDKTHSDKLSTIILILSTTNLLLPAIGLFRLSQNRFNSHKLGLRMNILHNFLRIILVNVPYMVLRISFWVSIQREISIFLLKNALFLFVSIRHIITELHELRKPEEIKDQKDSSLPLRVLAEQNFDNNVINE